MSDIPKIGEMYSLLSYNAFRLENSNHLPENIKQGIHPDATYIEVLYLGIETLITFTNSLYCAHKFLYKGGLVYVSKTDIMVCDIIKENVCNDG